MNIKRFRYLVIEPTLLHLTRYNKRMLSTDALNLMCGTVLLEGAKGNHVAYHKQIKGPALSPFQVEPDTMFDNYQNFISARHDLNDLVDELRISDSREEDLMCNPFFACAMARIKYWRSPKAIPAEASGKAAYYKSIYNSHKGAADIEKAIDVFKSLC